MNEKNSSKSENVEIPNSNNTENRESQKESIKNIAISNISAKNNIDTNINNIKLLDKIIENGFCTKYPISMMISIFLGFIANGIVINIFNLIILPANDIFKTSEFFLSLIAGSFFIGSSIGSAIQSTITTKYGRSKPIKFFYFLLLLFQIISSLYLNMYVFLISRTILGLCVGIAEPLLLNNFAEFLPSRIRGIFLIFSWIFASISILIMNLTALFIIPNLESEKLQKYLMAMNIPFFINFVVIFFIMEDSPRFGFVYLKYVKNVNKKNKIFEKIIKILKNMNKKDITENEKLKLQKEGKLDSSIDKKIKPKISQLFYHKYLKSTILGIFLFFIYACTYNGFYLISTLTVQALNKNNNSNLNDENEQTNRNGIIKNQIYIAIFDLIINIISTFLTKIKFIGRKGIIWIFMLLCAIIIIPSISNIYLFDILFPISLSLSDVAGDTLVTYFSEIFETNLRDLSSGFLLTTMRISGFISQFLFLGFYKVDYKIPYFFGCILNIIGVILVFLLPYEPEGKRLDDSLVSNRGNIRLNEETEKNVEIINAKNGK